jgi:hypothetical protein
MISGSSCGGGRPKNCPSAIFLADRSARLYRLRGAADGNGSHWQG